jgi:hypothetical protein
MLFTFGDGISRILILYPARPQIKKLLSSEQDEEEIPASYLIWRIRITRWPNPNAIKALPD